MIDGLSVLAVVPARSGSKGIPDKNLAEIGGVSLIGLAGLALSGVAEVDARIISTDSPRYAAEAEKYGLAAPFLRPAELSSDTATAVDTMVHAVLESERHFGRRFDIALIIEPTSPMRTAADVSLTIRRLVETNAGSAVTVSPVPTKFHPLKILKGDSEGRLSHFDAGGAAITGRQQLKGGLFYRNGVCYALRRETLIEQRTIFTPTTIGVIIDRTVVNLDDPEELEWARWKASRQ